MSLLRHLPALLIGAAAGAAVYFLTREEKDQEYEHIVGPEDVVEVDEEDAPEQDADTDAAATPAEPEAAPAARSAAPVYSEGEAPNANPVTLGSTEVPKTADGKLDATKIADPADFGDWDEQGCQG